MKRSFIGFLSTFALDRRHVVWGNSSGPPDGHHGEVQNCTSCHNDRALNSGDGSIRLYGLPSNYIPGQTYDLTALVSGTHVRGYGFQLIAKAGSSPSGSLAAVSSGMVISNGYAEHTTRSTSGSWNFQWTAPSTNEGNVTFFASGLATGGLNNSAGDQVYTYSRTLLEPPSLEWNSSVGRSHFFFPGHCFRRHGLRRLERQQAPRIQLRRKHKMDLHYWKLGGTRLPRSDRTVRFTSAHGTISFMLSTRRTEANSGISTRAAA